VETFAALVLVGAIAALVSIVVQSLRLGISPMPSSRKAREAVLRLVPLDTTGLVFELGAGWGGLAVALARQVPGARVIACEGSPVPFAVMWLRARLLRVPNLELRFGDFATCSLHEASVVVCYLWPGAMKQLEQRFLTELRVGARIVSNTFALRGWHPETTMVLDDVYRTHIYLYLRSMTPA
jgi:precorrin-6B methylase 2